MLVSDIVRRVRETAGDSTAIQFSNATLTDWINDGIRESVIENSLLQAKASSSTVANQSEYVLPADIFKLYSVYVDGIKLRVLTLQEWEEYCQGANYNSSSTALVPSVGYQFAGVLNLWPTPSGVTTLTINYSKIPATINHSVGPPEAWLPNEPAIPAAFHNRLVTYCLAQVALQDDDYTKYEALMIEFKTGVRDLSHAKDQQDDLYPFISVSSRDTDYE